jgi:hypothetical protein
MQSGAESGETSRRNFRLSDQLRSGLILAAAFAIMLTFSIAVMSYLASPDGWVMQAAKQAIMDQQQAVHTIHLINATN